MAYRAELPAIHDLAGDADGMASAAALYAELGLEFDGRDFTAGFDPGLDRSVVSEICRRIDTEAVAAALGMDLITVPLGPAPDFITDDLECSFAMDDLLGPTGDVVSGALLLVSPRTADTGSPSGLVQWGAFGSLAASSELAGVGDAAWWAASHDGFDGYSSLYVEMDGAAAMLLARNVTSVDPFDAEPVPAPRLLFALHAALDALGS